MKIADFDFDLPEGLIALRPEKQRDNSKLLVLHRDGLSEHRRFFDLPSYLKAGDLLVLNNTKVFPARLTGQKPTGGKLEILLVNVLTDGQWQILSKGGYTGRLRISEDLSAYISEGRTALFECNGNLMERIWETGMMPLPPYIRRLPDNTDRIRYQTVYAEVEGSIAAPTAGLHFTQELLDRIEALSVRIRTVTLHVGPGTFRPVKSASLEDHRMDGEFFEIEPSLLFEIAEAKQRGSRLITVGTTTTRAIEGYLSGQCRVLSSNGTIRGETDIFIRKGYTVKAVDSLITNFHLPRSTPLMLTSVFAGRENLLRAYCEAIALGYRFFSYGDAMLVI